MTRWFALLVWFAALVLASSVSAQGRYSVQLTSEASRVEVNQPFRVTLSALTDADDANPSAPALSPPPGITVLGSPSIGTEHRMSFSGGRSTVRSGLRATWQLSASRTGRFTIGPASVVVGSKRVRSNTTIVDVVPAGAGGRRAPRRSPFGGLFGPPGWPAPFGSFPDFPDPGLRLDDDTLDPHNLPSYPRELAIDEAPDEVAFLHATIAPKRVVVGEATTLRVVAYGRGGRFAEGRSTEPSTSSFISYPIHDTSYGLESYLVPIDDQVWRALKVRELLLFPVETGTLEIGPMTMQFVTPHGRPYMGRQVERSTLPIEVVVTEPPQAGRPPGYVLGDVGRFSLRATVQPREVSTGQAISVIIKVEGTGNFPTRLRTPQQKGVEWLEPTVTDEIDIDGGKLRGWKRFSYVVRLQQPGRIELGEIVLPHWDPIGRKYATARVALGAVAVAAGETAPANGSEAADRLATLIEPRTELGPPPRLPLRLADRSWFWLLLACGPLSVVVAAGAVRAGSVLGERWRSQRESLTTQVGKALAEAQRARRGGNTAATASAGERALFLALEAATGIKARGMLRDELRAKLQQARVAEELTDQIGALLDAYDAVRFTGASDLTASELLKRTEDCVRRVRRIAPRRRAA